jgi:hypothetical protein
VVTGKIKDHYFEIKAGIGLNKSPELYGAFPTDAYSHTPGNAGAQQPGMTGQVKEDFISRMREIGMQIQDGEIKFQSSLLNPGELLTHPGIFEYFNLKGENQQLMLQPGQLAFTICQVPVVYSISPDDKIVATFNDGRKVQIEGHATGKDLSAKVFQRTGEIVLIEVSFSKLVD